jgi:tRNA pseudouridine13 synthase
LSASSRLLPYRIKCRPEDFRVEEVTDLRPSRSGRYRLYRLTKTEWNTVDLIVRLARDLRLPRDAFSFGGRKDRQAVTSQMVTIRDRADRSRRGPGYSLECIGSIDEPMTSQRIRANEFVIVLRDIADGDLPVVESNTAAVRSSGLPNYFDDQRFGSLDPELGLLGEAILRGRWEAALRIHLTLAPPDAPDVVREHGRRIDLIWRNWRVCLAEARSVTERRIFEHLLARPTDFQGACARVPHDAIAMALSAFQSHLWNRIACSIAEDAAADTAVVPGLAGPYVFPLHWRPTAYAGARRLTIPLPGPRMRLIHAELARTYFEVLARAGLREDAFTRIGLPSAAVRAVPRAFLLRPDRLRLQGAGPDDMHKGRMQCSISFALPRGAYGTMIVKRLAIRL